MAHYKRMLVALPLLAFVFAMAAPVAVYADDGADDSVTTTSTSSGTGSSEDESEEKTEAEKKAREAAKEAAKRQAKQAIDKAKLERKAAKTTEERKKKCESRKQGLEQKVANIVKVAQRHQERIAAVQAKIVAYQADNNVQVTDWDGLKASAVAAGDKAKASVTALSELKPTIDCSSQTVASDVAAFKAATAQARTDLKDYRKAVKAMWTAIEAAQETTEDSNE